MYTPQKTNIYMHIIYICTCIHICTLYIAMYCIYIYIFTLSATFFYSFKFNSNSFQCCFLVFMDVVECFQYTYEHKNKLHMLYYILMWHIPMGWCWKFPMTMPEKLKVTLIWPFSAAIFHLRPGGVWFISLVLANVTGSGSRVCVRKTVLNVLSIDSSCLPCC